MENASRASLEEEVYLRALTGYVVGQNLFDGFRKIAIITYPDRICSSMASALATSLISKYGYKENFVKVFNYEENKEEELVKRIKEFKPDTIYISFGGEQKMSYISKITYNLLVSLMKENCMASLVFHVRTWLATKQLSNLLSDEKLKKYLESLKEIRLFTADLQNKKFLFHRVKIEGNNVKLEKFKEFNINDEHVNLLKISLPPPE